MSLVLAALLAVASGDNAPPQRAGECRWVHGRYSVYNGSSVRRIWVIGTRRIIALGDDEDLPPSMERYQQGWRIGHDLFGDFYVCARENSRPGHMQHVRLVRARNLFLQDRSSSWR